MFLSGTKSILSPFCGLARGNPQWLSVLDLFNKLKISRLNFLTDLKVQSKHRDNNCPVRMYTKLFEVKNGKIETIFGFLDALNRD